MHLAHSADRDVVERGQAVLPGMAKEGSSIGSDFRLSTLNCQSGSARDLYPSSRDVLLSLPGLAHSTQDLLLDSSNHFAWSVKIGVGHLIQQRAVGLVADACVHRCP